MWGNAARDNFFSFQTKRLEQEKQEHWAILDALKQRDAQLAKDMVRRHVQNLSHELTEILGIPEDVVRPLDEL
jgi:DNA-binding GntR family transcriptional regulator